MERKQEILVHMKTVTTKQSVSNGFYGARSNRSRSRRCYSESDTAMYESANASHSDDGGGGYCESCCGGDNIDVVSKATWNNHRNCVGDVVCGNNGTGDCDARLCSLLLAVILPVVYHTRNRIFFQQCIYGVHCEMSTCGLNSVEV